MADRVARSGRGDRLGVVRLERLFREGPRLVSQSSVTSWLSALAERTDALALVAPVCRGGPAEAVEGGFRLRKEDRLLSLPDARGYLRVALIAPLLLLQLVRLRLWCRRVLCRVPEHGNLLVLPLLRLLGFRVTIWLVADRREAERSHLERRGSCARVRAGLLLSRATGLVERRFLKRVPVIANGAALGRRVRNGARREGRVLVVTSTAMPREHLPADGPGRGPSPECVKLLYVGRLAPEKGLADLVEALHRCAGTRGPGRFALRLVGWDSHGEAERLKKMAGSLGVGSALRIEGPKRYGPELFDAFRTADLFVLPSHTEGTPRVFVEAMAHGLPIIATDVGGVPDLVRHGENGLLVPRGRPDALSEAILGLASDSACYERMSRANMRKARGLCVEDLAAEMCRFMRTSRCPSEAPRVEPRGACSREDSARAPSLGDRRGCLKADREPSPFPVPTPNAAAPEYRRLS